MVTVAVVSRLRMAVSLTLVRRRVTMLRRCPLPVLQQRDPRHRPQHSQSAAGFDQLALKLCNTRLKTRRIFRQRDLLDGLRRGCSNIHEGRKFGNKCLQQKRFGRAQRGLDARIKID